MTNIKDKLKAEERNERSVRLWPEGKFYKAYERSAYLFVKQVRAYEPRSRYIQAVGQDVVSIGFPQSVLESLGLHHAPATDGAEVITLQTTLDEQQFQLWRESLHPTPGPILHPAPDPAPERGGESRREKFPSSGERLRVGELSSGMEGPGVEGINSVVIKRLREFNLATATPMQCMLLLSELQTMLTEKGYGI